MKRKGPCRFKENCKNFIAGKQCPFSHDPCKFGNRCKDKANCIFFHDPSGTSSKPNQTYFIKSRDQIQCKFGAKCNKNAEGKCPYKHSDLSMVNESQVQTLKKIFVLPKEETLCKFGARCNMFPLGKCPFKHDPSDMPVFQQKNSMQPQRQHEDFSQSFRNVLSGLCFNFLMDRIEGEQCGKPHEYTSTKNIKKIFQADNQKIAKCQVFQYYQQDEQPIYAVLTEGKIIFGQLTNLAKQSGMEHVNNSSLIFKRCFDKDIAFHNQIIEDFYLLHSICQDYPRIDILVMKGNKNLHICLINCGAIKSMPNNRNILTTIFIKSHLLIVFQDNTKLFLRYDPSTVNFYEDNCPITHPIHNCKGYFKKLYGSQISGGILNERTVCFINQKFETFHVEFEEKVKDLLIIQLLGSPSAFVLTEKQISFINLVTFQKKPLLQGTIGQDLTFTSMIHTLDHLFLAIDGWGVLIYNTNTFQSPVGFLALGDRQWKLSGDDRGNLSVLSREKDGFSSWWIFKVRRH